MEVLIEKLKTFYTMSRFKDTDRRNSLHEEIMEIEKELGVHHKYYDGTLTIEKILFKEKLGGK